MTEHRWGSHGVIALCNLALATGNIGRRGTGIKPTTGQNMVQGASDAGCLPIYFTGYQSLNDSRLCYQASGAHRPPTAQSAGYEDSGDGGLWIIGYDVVQTDPNLHKVRETLARISS